MAKNQETEFNPVKEMVGGKAAEKVVWSTKVIEVALQALEQGKPLKASPFYAKNTKLLKPELVYKRTKEEIEDYIKCKQDPIYFASKCFLMTPEGLKACVLRDYQEEYLTHLQNNRFSIFLSCRQSGKCLVFNQLGNFIIPLVKLRQFNIDKNYKCEQLDDNNAIVKNFPFYELYNMFCKQTDSWKFRYSLYKENRFDELSKLESYLFKNKDKIIENIEIEGVFVYTDTGYKNVTNFITKNIDNIWHLELENGMQLDCADEHIVFLKDYSEIFVADLKEGDEIITENGSSIVTKVFNTEKCLSMCDISIDSANHRYYSNGILSHNSTTTAIYCLWVILFNTDKTGLILSKSGPAGADLVKKIKDMYLYLPYHLKIGTMKWNQSEISFDNNSSISTEAFSPTAGLGKTINFLILDEFAWCPPNDVDLFYNNIIPTVTTISDSNVCIMSTQNGFNLFYKIWKGAIEKKNIYAPIKVDWWQVPQFNPETKQWEKRTEKWKEMMVGILGSEEDFQYQYGTAFSASDHCLVSRECLGRLRDTATLWENRRKDIEDAGIYLFLRFPDMLFWRPDFDFARLRDSYFVICADLAEGSGQDFTPYNIFMLTGKDSFYHCGRWYSNNIDLEGAALEFWLLVGQLFNGENCIWSLEWNTYGALFYKMLMNLNEPDYDEASSFRWNLVPEGIETSNFVMYKKTSIDDQVAGKAKRTSNFIHGIKFTSGNKGTACSLLKIMFEKSQIDTTDLITIGELENFEDKSGNGSYKASYGHDDSIMTFVQLPMLVQTSKYKDLLEEYEASNIMGNIESKWSNNNYSESYYDYPQQGGMYDIFSSGY